MKKFLMLLSFSVIFNVKCDNMVWTGRWPNGESVDCSVSTDCNGYGRCSFAKNNCYCDIGSSTCYYGKK